MCALTQVQGVVRLRGVRVGYVSDEGAGRVRGRVNGGIRNRGR